MKTALSSTTNRGPAAAAVARAAALTLAGGLSLLLLASPARAADPPPEFYGVVPQEAPDATDFAQMSKDRVGMVRQLINWPWVEPEQGVYDWSYYDDVMRQATASGVRVWPVLFGTPGWAQQQGADCGGTCPPRSLAAREAFARFAAAAAERYGPGGDFWTEPDPTDPVDPVDPPPCPLPPLPCLPAQRVAPCACGEPLPIEVWQIWNEPNSPKYFGPRPDPRLYASMLERSAAAIRAEQPGAEIVIGGMWGPRDTDAVTPVRRYLKKLLRDPDTRAAFDAVALHPYGPDLRAVFDQVRDGRDVLDNRGASDAGIWVTEIGWASGGARSEPLVTSKRQQASLLRRSFERLIRKRRAWNIRGAHWFSWRDTSKVECKWCPKSGLRTKSGAPKPAARVFRRLPRAGG